MSEKTVIKANMYNNRSNQSLLEAAITAALGAGIVTSFAIGQGQNPLIAFGITGFAVVAALVCDRLLSLK